MVQDIKRTAHRTPMIFIASDHTGFETKKLLVQTIKDKYNILDLGTHSTESVDYNDYAQELVQKMLEDSDARGILICGTGIGMSIAANRNVKVRAALCYNIESAVLARQHNNSNVLVLSARTVNNIEIVNAFLSTNFSDEERHIRRVKKLGC